LRRADRRLAAATRTGVEAIPHVGDRRLAAAARTGYVPTPGDDRDVRLHEARKAYKRARYAAEAVVPVAGSPARRLAKRLGDLQDVLGAHQDAIVAQNLLRDYAIHANAEGENAFTYGLLHARQYATGERVLDRLDRVRRRAARRKLRRWARS
jgi:CHAD domain-containing protein